ncbi:MFS transporter [Sediminispirochaeta bajacaliforniensis]|uniref:MFS transporter n=1 Tax=Sediminispirochaeta bajacaliforniensis TaxID=148 RepID=UPI0004768E56|nr:MFS transporter [Sediminispirochaeta bajacaliforniensis]
MKNWKTNTVLFLVSQAMTLFGSTVVQMAVIWFVTKQTSLGKWVAVFTICSYLPQFLISFAGGVWADRYDRKHIIIGTDAVIALVTFGMFLLVPYIVGAGHQNMLLYALLVMSAVRSFGAGIQTPAVYAVLPSIAPETELMRFNGINATFQAVMQFASPAAAGMLLSYSSIRYALLVDVVTAAIGISMCLFVAIPQITSEGKGDAVPETNASDTKQTFFTDMKYGLRYVASSPLIARVLIVYGLFIFLSTPAGFLAQLYVNRTYGTAYWYMTAVELVGFFGMTGGGILMSTWGGFKNRQKTFATGLALFGVLAVGMGFSPNFILYLGCMLLYGIALTITQTAATTLIQENAEVSMQGRVFGLLSSAYALFLPIGMAVFGPLADTMSMKIIMIASGLILFLIGGTVHISTAY